MKFILILITFLWIMGRSREGAWIEIPLKINNVSMILVAPVRERGLKSRHLVFTTYNQAVAPVRERGLKCLDHGFCLTKK